MGETTNPFFSGDVLIDVDSIEKWGEAPRAQEKRADALDFCMKEASLCVGVHLGQFIDAPYRKSGFRLYCSTPLIECCNLYASSSTYSLRIPYHCRNAFEPQKKDVGGVGMRFEIRFKFINLSLSFVFFTPGRNQKSIFRRRLFLLFIYLEDDSFSSLYLEDDSFYSKVLLLALSILPSFMMEKGPKVVIYSILIIREYHQ